MSPEFYREYLAIQTRKKMVRQNFCSLLWLRILCVLCHWYNYVLIDVICIQQFSLLHSLCSCNNTDTYLCLLLLAPVAFGTPILAQWHRDLSMCDFLFVWFCFSCSLVFIFGPWVCFLWSRSSFYCAVFSCCMWQILTSSVRVNFWSGFMSDVVTRLLCSPTTSLHWRAMHWSCKSKCLGFFLRELLNHAVAAASGDDEWTV